LSAPFENSEIKDTHKLQLFSKVAKALWNRLFIHVTNALLESFSTSLARSRSFLLHFLRASATALFALTLTIH